METLSIYKAMRPSSARRDIKGAVMPLKYAHKQAGRADGASGPGVASQFMLIDYGPVETAGLA